MLDGSAESVDYISCADLVRMFRTQHDNDFMNILSPLCLGVHLREGSRVM